MKVIVKESLKYMLRSRPVIFPEIRHVQRLYRLSDDELHSYKERKFLRIFRLAYRRSPYYRDLYQSEGLREGDVQSIDDLKLLPVLTKDVLRAHGSKMLTVPDMFVVRASTSGTTGTPLSVFHDYRSIRLEQAYNWQRRKICGFRYGERLVSLRGQLGSNRLSAYAPIMNTLFLSSYMISEARAREYYQKIIDYKPRAIEGFPSSLYNLAVLFRGLNLKLGVPLCFTSSETLFPFQREVIEDVFGTRVFDYYGCAEQVVALSQLRLGAGYHEDPGYAICEYREDCVIATSLINTSFPLIRYQVNDIVFRDVRGDVVSVSGRADDSVICKDGTKLVRFGYIFRDVPGLDLAQIVQRKVGEMDINIVTSPDKSKGAARVILGNLKGRISPENLVVRVNEVARSDILYSRRGKFSLVKSLL